MYLKLPNIWSGFLKSIFCFFYSGFRQSTPIMLLQQEKREELNRRKSEIEQAIVDTELKKFEIVNLAGKFESRLTSSREDVRDNDSQRHQALNHLRLNKLRVMNGILERLCLLRQCQSDIEFLCLLAADDGSLEGKQDGIIFDKKCLNFPPSSCLAQKIPSLARRLGQISDILARLKPLDSFPAQLVSDSTQQRPLSSRSDGGSSGRGSNEFSTSSRNVLNEQQLWQFI